MLCGSLDEGGLGENGYIYILKKSQYFHVKKLKKNPDT